MEPEGDGVTAAVTAAGLGVSGCLKLGQELKIGFEFRTVEISIEFTVQIGHRRQVRQIKLHVPHPHSYTYILGKPC